MAKRPTSTARVIVALFVAMALALGLLSRAVHATSHCHHGHGIEAGRHGDTRAADMPDQPAPSEHCEQNGIPSSHSDCGFLCHGAMGLTVAFELSAFVASHLPFLSAERALEPLEPAIGERPPRALLRG